MGKNNNVTPETTEQKPAEVIKICAGCKKRYDETMGWIPFDPVVEENGSVLFSHALCPECLKRIYSQYL